MSDSKASEIRAVAEQLQDCRDHMVTFLNVAGVSGPDEPTDPLELDAQAVSQAIDALNEYADYVGYTEGEGGA